MSNAMDEVATLTADLRAWLEWQGELGASALPRESIPASELHPIPEPTRPVQRAAPPRPKPIPQQRPSSRVSTGAPTESPIASPSKPASTPKERPSGQAAGMSDKWKALMAAPTTHRLSGPQDAALMIVRGSGSSPKAEAMLDRMLENVLGVQRNAVCIVDLHRDTRSPADIGAGFRKALSQLKPSLLLVMGRFAVQALYGDDQALDSLRGRWMDIGYEDGKAALRVTHHPEAILLLAARGQTAPKRETFDDLKALSERLTSA